jgi:hypothetical protein
MIEINGKAYPMWSQFVEGKDEWIGGILEDFGDSMDVRLFGDKAHGKTEITDITLESNGENDAFFSVHGKDFGCGFSTSCGGIGAGEDGWITFFGYGGHTWRIKKPDGGTP